MPISARLEGFMGRWSMRKHECWRPGLDNIDPRVICANCTENSWYDGDCMDVKFQMNGQYLCKECRVHNPIQVAICQSIPYEVLSIVMDICQPEKVQDIMWDFKRKY